MMNLRERITTGLKDAMRDKDATRICPRCG